MTVPEFFEVKFSRRLRVFTGVLVAIGGILNMGVFLRVEGTFLAIISGISLTHIKAVMTGILLLELVYTVLGGMISIVITDFIQFIALSVGTILVTIWSLRAAGISHMYDAVKHTMGNAGFSPLANPEYGWAYIIFQVLVWMAVHTCSGSHAANACHGSSFRRSRSGRRRNARRNHVGEQFLPSWLEFNSRTGHYSSAAATPDEFAPASDAESRSEFIREYFRDGLGTLVHATGADVFLFEHDGEHLSFGNAGYRDCGFVLEARVNTGRLLGHGGRRGCDDRVFLFQSARKLRRARRVRVGWHRNVGRIALAQE
jgi:hypothetical protein